MADLLAPLYALPSDTEIADDSKTVRVRRAMAYELEEVARYVGEHFNERWASETRIAFSEHPIRCFVAIKDGALCGFACYDVTFRGFFGPTGVSEEARGSGIGRALLLNALRAMKDVGYAYAIIGDVGSAQSFYERAVNARVIPGSEPGAYEYDLRAIAQNRDDTK
jgi:ribosomal protein S18 acetylase RimI-like enzyme